MNSCPLSFRTVCKRAKRAEGERGIRCAAEKRYFVYILASKGRVYTSAMTGFLMARMLQHKSGESEGFTRVTRQRLVYYEVFRYVNNAIARETEIKKWRREKKVALVEAGNPTWERSCRRLGSTAPLRKQIPHRLKPVRNDKNFR